MSKTKLTRRILTGLVLLVGASGAVTVANEVNNAAVNVNKKDVKVSVYEKNGHYYVKLTTAKNVTNVVARITTENRKEYVVKKEAIKAGEVVEYEIDINADVPTRKLPHTAVKRETVKSVVTLGNHTFNTVVSYDVEVADSQEQAAKPVDKNTEKKTTLDQLAEKREVTAEQKAKEEEAKKVAEAKAVADAEAKKVAEEKVVADAKAKEEAEAKKVAEAKAVADAKAKEEAEAKKVAEAKAVADAKAKEEAEAKKVAEAKAAAKKATETKAATDAKLKQEAEAKAKAEKEEAKKANELKAKQEAAAKKEAEAKQATTVAGGLPEVTAAELADPAMNGLTPHTKKMKVALAKKFGITSFSLFREGDDDGTGHGHNSGMAVDFMVPVNSAQGDQLAEYLTKHMDELGVYYVIWKQRFYMPQQNIYGPANTWNMMPNRGGITANHYDHVHVSFKK